MASDNEILKDLEKTRDDLIAHLKDLEKVVQDEEAAMRAAASNSEEYAKHKVHFEGAGATIALMRSNLIATNQRIANVKERIKE